MTMKLTQEISGLLTAGDRGRDRRSLLAGGAVDVCVEVGWAQMSWRVEKRSGDRGRDRGITDIWGVHWRCCQLEKSPCR
jgi:hypothetical protein